MGRWVLALRIYTQPTYTFQEVDKLGGRMIGANFISHCRRVLLDAKHYRDMFVSNKFVSDTFICMLMLSIARSFNVTKNI